MIDLKQNIKVNGVYTNSGPILSKALLSKDLLNQNESFLIVVENDGLLMAYLKIMKFLNIKINFLDNIADFINIIENKTGKYIVTKDFFNIETVSQEQFIYKYTYQIKKGETIEITKLTEKLNNLGIKFNEFQNPFSFSIGGDTINFIDKTGQSIKISFWDNEIEEILVGNKKLDKYTFGANLPICNFVEKEKINKDIVNLLFENDVFTILDSIDFYSNFDFIFSKLEKYLIFSSLGNLKNIIDLGFSDLVIQNIDDFKSILEKTDINKYIITKNIKTINSFIDLNNLKNIKIIESDLNNIKSFKSKKDILIGDDNISRIFIKKRIKRTLSENLDLLMQIKQGDYIVHIDHGVGIFREIVTKELPVSNRDGITKEKIIKEYIRLDYKNEDKLFIPITEVSRVSKYVGVENPKLTSLSTKEWDKKIKKVSEDVDVIAGELLEIYAKRKIQKGHSFLSKKEEEAKFLNSFEYVYTEDQITVINEIYTDMESSNPMDRLLSGDVGFGKTEIAFASIYKALINNKQAALISPLVVLAYEHFEKAKERFNLFPFNIEVITRFEKPNIIKATLQKLSEGKIDFIIGTHRLLSEDIKFKDLGLLVIDEEHKFGVKDKEKIKKFKGNIDILSMSATPIPRSLNMALNGIKQVSMLTTAPVGREPIQTIVSPFDDTLIYESCKREFNRGGQVFFIHNRVETILGMQHYLEKLLPGKKIALVHGQLPGDTLEKRILEFKRRKYDILLATTVIENGIDFSNVNTIFINDSTRFGISQIHQLRGRVGRGNNKGYCYLLFKKDKIKEDAAKRLKTIVDYSHLGAGFELAIKDLEIRGGGDILGIKQSGKSVEVGISLFLEMLENKIEKLKIEKNLISKNEVSSERINTTIDLNIDAYIPDDFFNSELDKINFYREIESIKKISDLNNLILDFKEINKNIPKSTNNLFDLIKLKILSAKYKIKSIRKVGINYQLDFKDNTSLEELKEFLLLDKEVKFVLINSYRIRSSIKNFPSEQKFIEYLLLIFDKKIKPKIKFKRKL